LDVDLACKEKLAPVTMAVLKLALEAKSFAENSGRWTGWVELVDRELALTASVCGEDAVVRELPWAVPRELPVAGRRRVAGAYAAGTAATAAAATAAEAAVASGSTNARIVERQRGRRQQRWRRGRQ
jgi:hypothetical protein